MCQDCHLRSAHNKENWPICPPPIPYQQQVQLWPRRGKNNTKTVTTSSWNKATTTTTKAKTTNRKSENFHHDDDDDDDSVYQLKDWKRVRDCREEQWRKFWNDLMKLRMEGEEPPRDDMERRCIVCLRKSPFLSCCGTCGGCIVGDDDDHDDDDDDAHHHGNNHGNHHGNHHRIQILVGHKQCKRGKKRWASSIPPRDTTHHTITKKRNTTKKATTTATTTTTTTGTTTNATIGALCTSGTALRTKIANRRQKRCGCCHYHPKNDDRRRRRRRHSSASNDVVVRNTGKEGCHQEGCHQEGCHQEEPKANENKHLIISNLCDACWKKTFPCVAVNAHDRRWLVQRCLEQTHRLDYDRDIRPMLHPPCKESSSTFPLLGDVLHNLDYDHCFTAFLAHGELHVPLLPPSPSRQEEKQNEQEQDQDQDQDDQDREHQLRTSTRDDRSGGGDDWNDPPNQRRDNFVMMTAERVAMILAERFYTRTYTDLPTYLAERMMSLLHLQEERLHRSQRDLSYHDILGTSQEHQIASYECAAHNIFRHLAHQIDMHTEAWWKNANNTKRSPSNDNDHKHTEDTTTLQQKHGQDHDHDGPRSLPAVWPWMRTDRRCLGNKRSCAITSSSSHNVNPAKKRLRLRAS